MKNKLLWQHLVVIIMSCLPLMYLALVWNNIPAQIPLHFDESLKPDEIGEKIYAIIPSLVLATVAIGIYFIFRNIHRIDPKRNTEAGKSVFYRLGFILAVFLTALNFITLISMIEGVQLIDKLMLPIMGLLFAVIGNYMHAIRPNYFAGIRLPWTLDNEVNWKRTHQLAGKIWFAGGVFITVSTVFLPFLYAFKVVFATVIIMVLIPSIFSFWLFKKGNPDSSHQKNNSL